MNADNTPSASMSETPVTPMDEHSATGSEEKTPRVEAEISRMDDAQFANAVDKLMDYGEEMRLQSMRAQRTRSFISMSVGLTAIIIGASGFGWFLLVDAQFGKALGCILLGLVIAVGLYIWSLQKVSAYKKNYKTQFLPRMAKLLGGFKYYPARGISRKLLAKTGVVPAHDIYEAEDCFMGRYKGVKVMFSEARLLHKQKYMDPIFNGLFVLLEAPEAKIKGHTVITADPELIQRSKGERWAKFGKVDVPVSNPAWNRFSVLSNTPEGATGLVSEALLKELSEAADIFEKSPLTTVFFRGKFIFIMIPYEGDMFEASDVQVPVTTKRHAMQCKQEIEKILEVIDVFDLYENSVPAS